jgi:hypothetical protein
MHMIHAYFGGIHGTRIATLFEAIIGPSIDSSTDDPATPARLRLSGRLDCDLGVHVHVNHEMWSGHGFFFAHMVVSACCRMFEPPPPPPPLSGQILDAAAMN